MKFNILLLLVLTTSCLMAISGNYTVGGINPDYVTLTQALAEISATGLTGDVQLTLRPGTYEGPFIVQHQSNGFQLTITSGSYSSGDVILSNPNSTAADNYILKIASTPYVNLIGLSFNSSGTYSRALLIEGDSDNLILNNNIFNGVLNSGYSNNTAIDFCVLNNAEADNITIASNQFNDGGFHVNATSSNYNNIYNTWVISSNIHIRGYAGVVLTNSSNISIKGETYSDLVKAIDINSTSGSLDVSCNRVTACQYGVIISNSNVTNHTDPHVYNNVISVTGPMGLSVYGWGLNIYHNSILSITTESYNNYAAFFGGSDLQVRQNHIISLGAATTLAVQGVDPNYSQRNIIEHNNIYTNYTTLASVNNALYHDIEDFNNYALVDNISLNPLFTSESLHTVSPWMDNKYPSCGVITDYSGVVRSVTNSDIGAREYTSDTSLTPLSGIYTIGTGGTYSTLNDFFYAAMLRGLSDNTTGRLIDAVYEGHFELETVPGCAENHVLKLESVHQNGSILRNQDQSATYNYVLKLSQTRYLTLDLLKFESTNTSYSTLVNLKGLNRNLKINYCSFTAPTTASGTSIANPYYSESCDVDVIGCNFIGNNYAIEGRGTSWGVIGSSFSGNAYGVWMQTISDVRISSNSFDSVRSSAVSINDGKAINILNNRIVGAGTGILLSGGTYTGGSRSLIANNTVRLNGGSSSGIYISGNGINTINNSVIVTGYNAKALYSYSLGTNNDIANNIFAVDQGLSVEMNYFTPSDNVYIDYNCYYNEGNAFVSFGANQTSLSALQAAFPAYNQHSISLNPHFTQDMHSESPWLRNAGMLRPEITTDMDGDVREPAFDIGADQQTGPIVDNRLAGTYTVGTVGCDFPTIEEAITAVELYGIRTSVTMNITMGTYSGNYTLHDFPKLSPELMLYWVALESCDFRMMPSNNYNYENFFFHLVGAKGVSFNNLSMRLQAANHQSCFFVLDGRCENINFTNCSFNMTNALNDYTTGITTQRGEGSGISVTNCIFTNGSNGIYSEGPFYGTLGYSNITIQDCIYTNTDYPVYLQKSPNVSISGNQFNSNATAISLSYITGTSYIKNNKIKSSGTYGSYNGGTCMYLSNVTGSISTPVQIINNVIYTDQNNAQFMIALNCGYSSYIEMNHNNLISDNTTYNDYGGALVLSDVTNSSFKNNVFSAPTNGYSVNTNGCSELEFHANAYYASGRYLGSVSNLTYQAEDFIEGQLGDLYGVFANPLSDSNGYTQCSFLRDKGVGTGISTDVDGNNFGSPTDIGANVIQNYGAPLSGIITVGNEMQFTNLDEIITALKRRGISDDVIIEISPGEQSVSTQLGFIPNSQLYNVTFTGAVEGDAPILKKTANSDTDNYILRLYNVRNLTLTNIAFRALNPVYSKCLDIKRYTHNLAIDNCSFGTFENTITGTDGSAIYFYEGIIDGVRINNCHFTNSPYGLSFNGLESQKLLNRGLIFSNNTLSNASTGLYFGNVFAPVISGNTIEDFRYQGIYAYSNISDMEISANFITGNGGAGLVLNSLGTASGTHRVFNNYIRTGNTTSTTVSMSNSPNVKFYYNTMVNTYPSSNSSAFYHGAGCSGLEFVNNICLSSTGLAANFNQLSDFASRWDHNLFYSSGSAFVKLGASTINTAYDWNQNTGDQYSIFADPLLEENTCDLTAFSPACNSGIICNDINTDIYGVIRDNPDMGCSEYNFSSLTAPEHVTIEINRVTNMVKISWDLVPGAGAYKVMMADNPNAQTWTYEITGATYMEFPVNSMAKFYKIIAF